MSWRAQNRPDGLQPRGKGYSDCPGDSGVIRDFRGKHRRDGNPGGVLSKNW
jgi:hypothetical protein